MDASVSGPLPTRSAPVQIETQTETQTQAQNRSPASITAQYTLVPQLSCETCRARKVKCDKKQPCSACVATKDVCVPVHRMRRARGRHAPRATGEANAKSDANDGLRGRVRRLEAIIQRARQPVPIAIAPAPVPSQTTARAKATRSARGNVDAGVAVSGVNTDSTNPDTSPATNGDTTAYLSAMQHPGHFWADLTEAVSDLREAVQSSPDEAEDDTAQTHAEVSVQASYDRPRDISILGLGMGFGSAYQPTLGHAYILQNRPVAKILCNTYIENVDPILKILHKPTLVDHIMGERPYLGYPEGHPTVEALDTAVLYMAVNSLEEDQCLQLLGQNKAAMLSATREACEAAIEKAGVLTTRDMGVLQAFVIYLSGRQVEEPSRAVWTLIAVAVRIAKAMGANTPQNGEPFFVRQLRQSLWLTICVMDVQTSFNMTSQPLITAEEASVEPDRMPLHVCDGDYGLYTTTPPPERTGLADNTYALIKYRIQAFGRWSHFVPLPEARPDRNIDVNNPEDAQVLLDKFTHDLMSRSFGIDPSQSPLAWLVFHSAQCFVSGAKAALYKLQPDEMKQGRPGLLRACSHVLEKTVLMHTDPRGKGFRWSITVRWHILAMALAECYLCGRAQPPNVQLLQEVWPTMEASYTHHASIVGKHRGGKLSGPLSKLMAVTRQTVEAAIGDKLNNETAQSAQGIPVPQPAVTIPTDFPVDSINMADANALGTDIAWDTYWDDFMAAAAVDDGMLVYDTSFYEYSM